ncbi:sodium/proton antiporter, NhaA family [Trichlorobacter thiogenes]|uniref:Na(+)/H(+) antiporter NhaA n=1 Tax=Trichlorobacter thiogenes TaxID=115783 RepID=A0A1T4P9S9_9BACT|nr:Na+/H+ antiporter NhaA [Trichlorobacter thiogenes]SJZ88209.1 sodium/proton antiporter, NhaA family [Trichlorobacter thiogenes]
MQRLKEFYEKESSTGILLMLVTIAALLLKNSPLAELYNSFLHTPVAIQFGALKIAKPLLLWINDGLMAVFFLLVGLEVKRELIRGNLSSWNQATLPVIAAIGGMLVPALIYIGFTHREPVSMHGWAIPTATDIAFALGILSLLGSRVPASLKIFLLALAIIDDLGAIIIIALFYTSDLSLISIAVASITLLALFALNRFGVERRAAYILLGVVLWVSVLKSGVHATLAGVALAFMIPLETKGEHHLKIPLAASLEHDLHPWVSFMILPLFAFVNAGIDLRGLSLNQLSTPVPMGIMLGLFIGKQVGVFGFSWLAIKTGLARLPAASSWRQFYGVCLMTGIGFTMSLFIDSLAFTDDAIYQYADKLAIVLGSLLSGVAGYLVLRLDSSTDQT